MVDRIGEQIGNYRMVQLLGSGGFADVYLDQQVSLDSPAANYPFPSDHGNSSITRFF
jgi:hypothetical protein